MVLIRSRRSAIHVATIAFLVSLGPAGCARAPREVRSTQRTPTRAVARAGDEIVVRRGDTLYELARRYGTTTQDLALVNEIDDPRTLRIGQRLVLPDPEDARPVSATKRARPSADGRFAHADRVLRDVDRDVKHARFEEALARADQGRAELASLGGGAGAAERSARLEVLAATAAVALGRADAADESFRRALAAKPALTLDPRVASPKVIRAFDETRKRVAPSEADVVVVDDLGYLEPSPLSP